jgi:hypothetical protein
MSDESPLLKASEQGCLTFYAGFSIEHEGLLGQESMLMGLKDTGRVAERIHSRRNRDDDLFAFGARVRTDYEKMPSARVLRRPRWDKDRASLGSGDPHALVQRGEQTVDLAVISNEISLSVSVLDADHCHDPL